MRKRIAVIGGCGKIGQIISEELRYEFDIDLFDNAVKPGKEGAVTTHHFDICFAGSDHSYDPVFRQCDALIHLAWNSAENWRTNYLRPENKTMMEISYDLAVRLGIKRVIMASSIHADDFRRPDCPAMMTPDLLPVSGSFYGVSKVYGETLGRYYASKHGLKVVCIRFGGVDPTDIIRQELDYRQIMLTRRDCASLIQCCLQAPIPGKFCLLYGVSNNTGRIHDWQNPLGWLPEDDCAKL